MGGRGGGGFNDFNSFDGRRLRRPVRRFDGRWRWPPTRCSPGRGNDLRYNLTISLEEAFEGKRAQVRVPTSCRPARSATAPAAKASPSRPPARPVNGAGRVRSQPGLLHGRAHLCHLPRRRGEWSTNPCESCGGTRPAAESERRSPINVPAGVEDGTRIRLSGEGEAGACAAGNRAICTSLSAWQTASACFSRDGAQHVLPRADLDHDRGPGWRMSRCRRSRASGSA
jgi:molecular chaperone DnaJ